MAVALHACGTDATPTPANTSTTTTVAAEPGPTTTVAPEPGPTTTVAPEPGPTTTVAPERLSAAEVYSRVSPSIPFIETATSTGSGILIEGGYVVTNYHVVWPHLEAWIVFPDGTELSNVPLVGWNPWIDLAVLGPVNVSAPPLSLTDGEGMTPGSELFLVGYPAETDLFPEPSITQGILSRFREWDGWEITLLQTDAAIAGGQSGGALTNAFGEVVGISTWVFSDAGFAVATSAADDAVDRGVDDSRQRDLRVVRAPVSDRERIVRVRHRVGQFLGCPFVQLRWRGRLNSGGLDRRPGRWRAMGVHQPTRSNLGGGRVPVWP